MESGEPRTWDYPGSALSFELEEVLNPEVSAEEFDLIEAKLLQEEELVWETLAEMSQPPEDGERRWRS